MTTRFAPTARRRDRPRWNSVSAWARWSFATLIFIVSVALIAGARLTSGFAQRGWQYLMISIWNVTAVAVPVRIAFDLVANVIRAATQARTGDVRPALRSVATTAVADALLLAWVVVAGVIVLKLAR